MCRIVAFNMPHWQLNNKIRLLGVTLSDYDRGSQLI